MEYDEVYMHDSWWYVPYLQLTLAMIYTKKTIISSCARLIEHVITTGKNGGGLRTVLVFTPGVMGVGLTGRYSCV